MTIEEAISILKKDRDQCLFNPMFNPMTGEREPMNEDCRRSAEAYDVILEELERIKFKLKPCPFCGNQVTLHQARHPLPDFADVDKGDFMVMCRSCNMTTTFYKAKHPIEDLWNRRADDASYSET